MDIWLWICDLPTSPEEWSSTNNDTFVYPPTNSNPSSQTKGAAACTDTQTIKLIAELRSYSESDHPQATTDSTESSPCLTFSIVVEGFTGAPTKLWESDKCPLSSDKPLFSPLVLQLLQETVDRCPTAPTASSSPLETDNKPSSSPQPKLKVKPDSVEWILGTHSPVSFSPFFSLVFLTRLFWLCAFDAPTAVGSLYFHSFLSRNLDTAAASANNTHSPVLRSFLLAAGADVERSLARAVGYMLVKSLIMREMRVAGLASISPPTPNLVGLAYAAETHGLWVLKTHAPVWGMMPTLSSSAGKNPFLVVGGAKESALKYSLAHQQLEAVIQLDYSVRFLDDYIQVTARVDNIRLHVAKLGFQKEDNDNSSSSAAFGEEVYFPSRVRAWVGPEAGSSYVGSLSLGKSTGDAEREVEMQRVVKGNLGSKVKVPSIKATSRTSTRMKVKNWRWDQDAEGNTAVYDGVLHDASSGAEVYKMVDGRTGFKKRYAGSNRVFTKSGGVVFAGSECGERVTWRLGKEMEGSVLKWRVGSRVWLSYWPSDVKSSCYETRVLEVCDEVDLPLIPTK